MKKIRQARSSNDSLVDLRKELRTIRNTLNELPMREEHDALVLKKRFYENYYHPSALEKFEAYQQILSEISEIQEYFDTRGRSQLRQPY